MLRSTPNGNGAAQQREKPSQDSRSGNGSLDPALPSHRQDVAGKKPPKKSLIPIRPAGESGRSGVHPFQFLKLIWKSSSHLSTWVNILWPFVPIALAVYWSLPVETPHDAAVNYDVLKFSLAYVAMVPCANLIGFAGQELSRKLPHMIGVFVEIKMGSAVELIMFMVLLAQNQTYIIKAAILGSILATMLLNLGLCFFAAGLRREHASFDSSISEMGSGLLLISGVGLAIPTIFASSLKGENRADVDVVGLTTDVSRIIAVVLLGAYCVYLFFQMNTHHGIYDAIYAHDEHRDADGHHDAWKDKLTLTECIIALVVAIALVAILAIILVTQIHGVVEHTGINDPFMGLILVPLVEKAAENLTAIDEAWDNQVNLALSHCIGATIQTAMFNAPLAVVVS